MKDRINFHAKFATENFPETTDYPTIYPWFMKEKIGKKHMPLKNRTTSRKILAVFFAHAI